MARRACSGGRHDDDCARRLPSRKPALSPDRATRARDPRLGALDARPPARRPRVQLHVVSPLGRGDPRQHHSRAWPRHHGRRPPESRNTDGRGVRRGILEAIGPERRRVRILRRVRDVPSRRNRPGRLQTRPRRQRKLGNGARDQTARQVLLGGGVGDGAGGVIGARRTLPPSDPQTRREYAPAAIQSSCLPGGGQSLLADLSSLSAFLSSLSAFLSSLSAFLSSLSDFLSSLSAFFPLSDLSDLSAFLPLSALSSLSAFFPLSALSSLSAFFPLSD